MKFTSKTIKEYCQILSSDTPTPGGGSSLAVVCLNAISLVEMASNVTITKLAKKQQECKQLQLALFSLAPLHTSALEQIDLDGVAFENILTAMRLPKNTESEIATRTEQLQLAYTKSAELCLNLIDIAVLAYSIADTVIEFADKFVITDAYIGKTLLKDVAICQVYNVRANSDCIKSTETQQAIEDKMKSLLTKIM